MARSKPHGSFDTNVLLRYLLGDVPHQSAAIDILLAEGDTFEVTDAALFETVFVLENFYKMGRELIRDNVFLVTRNKQFVTNKKLFERCMPLYGEHPSLSIVDCALLEYARLRKATPLYTFDKKLVQNSGGDATIPV